MCHCVGREEKVEGKRKKQTNKKNRSIYELAEENAIRDASCEYEQRRRWRRQRKDEKKKDDRINGRCLV